MDAEFREIFELSCEKGFRAIIDEAEWHLTDDTGDLTAFVEKLVGAVQPFRAGDGHLPRPQAILEGGDPLLSRGHAALLAQAQEPAAPASGGGRRQPSRTCRVDPQLLPPHRGPGQQLRGGALPPWRTGLFLCLSRGLFAAERRMGGRSVRPPAAQSGLRGDLRLLAEGRLARPELPRLVQGHRAAARHVRDGDPQAARAAARSERRARVRPEPAA